MNVNEIGKYTFNEYPLFTYTCYKDVSGVSLVCGWHRVVLTQDEFNGCLWMGKIKRKIL